MTMCLYNDLKARGLIKQVTDEKLEEVLQNEKISLYAGFDPTADSLHVGSLLPLLTLRRFQLAGHKVIALVGGATGMIGDPSFKSQERSLLTPEQIRHNQTGITKVISRFLDLTGPNSAVVVNNADWFAPITFIDFLRDVGKHFTVNYMIAKESVRARLEDREHGISYTEFSYMILQAYDFYHLNKTGDCRLQIGGSDQWGNITAGTDLIRKMQAEKDAFGMTFPLVTKADGSKFGKSEKGNIWLDADKTSPYQFYQFFIQSSDVDVLTYLKFFTFLSHEEISSIEASIKCEPEKRLAQITLARELTRLVHGNEELARVEKASQALFGSDIKDLDKRSLEEVFADTPSTSKERSILTAGISLVDLLADSKLCNSKGAARKEITAGGVYVNNTRETNVERIIKENDLVAGEFLILRKGKRNYHIVKF